jgi:hypothetical protein
MTLPSTASGRRVCGKMPQASRAEERGATRKARMENERAALLAYIEGGRLVAGSSE